MGGIRKFKVITGIASGAAVIIVAAISINMLRPGKPESMPTEPQQTQVEEPSNSQLPLQEVDLFFFDVEALKLVREKRELHLSLEFPSRLKQIIRALISGSDHGLKSTIPGGVVLYEAFIDAQSTAYLDFSRHLADTHIGGTTAETMTIKSILQTVYANFPEKIQSVQILIEGQEVITIAGHIDISHPLVLSPDFQTPVEEKRANPPR